MQKMPSQFPEIATRDKKVSMEILEYIILNDYDILFLVRVTRANEDVSKYLPLIEKHPSTKFFQILEKTPTNLEFLVVVEDVTGIKAFEESFCFIKPPILVENGCRMYKLVVPSISCLSQAYLKVENVGKWKLVEIKKELNKNRC